MLAALRGSMPRETAQNPEQLCNLQRGVRSAAAPLNYPPGREILQRAVRVAPVIGMSGGKCAFAALEKRGAEVQVCGHSPGADGRSTALQNQMAF